jgi:hypothetical protein
VDAPARALREQLSFPGRPHRGGAQGLPAVLRFAMILLLRQTLTYFSFRGFRFRWDMTLKIDMCGALLF